MAIREKKTSPQKRLAVLTLGIALMVLCFSPPSLAQKAVRGTITGTVTSAQGQVIGFRVAAHNLDRRLWYTVFTSKGRYTVPQVLPGRYEVMVNEPEYDSPTVPLQLGLGESKTADLALKHQDEAAWKAANGDGNLDHRARPARNGLADDQGNFRTDAGKIVYVNSLEELFPPGPALGLLKEDCTGCDGNGWSSKHYNRDQFMEGIERATETGMRATLGRTPINKNQKEMLADYLVKNFGPGTPNKALRVDPLVPDERIFSKQIYVSYDVPEDIPYYPRGDKIDSNIEDGVIPQEDNQYAVPHLQAAFISPVDGNIWVSCGSCNSLLRLNPTAFDSSDRWKNYPIKGTNHVQPSGLTVDKQGHV